MTKKLVILSVAGCGILVLTAGADATAGQPAPAQTASPARLAVSPAILRPLTTSIHGTLDMTAAKTGKFASITCDKMSVTAASIATIPCQPGAGFCVPTAKWTHAQAALTPTANPAICNFNVFVAGGQAFALSASTSVHPCGGSGFAYVALKASPSTGQQTVPVGTSKEANLVVSAFVAECDGG
jgi:hypothetical protein